MAELLRGLFGKIKPSEEENACLLFALELADSFITYRTRYRLAPMLPLVLDVLLSDESKPRSIAFQLAALARHIDMSPHSGQVGERMEEQHMVLSLLAEMRLADVEGLAGSGADGTRGGLMGLFDRQVAALPALADVLARRYFNVLEKKVKWVRARSRLTE